MMAWRSDTNWNSTGRYQCGVDRRIERAIVPIPVIDARHEHSYRTNTEPSTHLQGCLI